MSKALKARLAKLEQRKFGRWLRLVYKLHPNEDAGEIVGFAAGNVTFLREAGESEADCAARAFRLAPGQPCLAAIHAKPPRSARETHPRALACPTPANAPEAPSGAEFDPFELSGIGRTATRAELERMGSSSGYGGHIIRLT